MYLSFPKMFFTEFNVKNVLQFKGLFEQVCNLLCSSQMVYHTATKTM